MNRNPSFGGFTEAGHQAEQCALAGSIPANDSQTLTPSDLKRDVLQSVKNFVLAPLSKSLLDVRAQQFGPAGMHESFRDMLKLNHGHN
jgi:hypothetical protein